MTGPTQPAAQSQRQTLHGRVRGGGALETGAKRLEMLERRAPPPFDDGQRGTEAHRRHREPHQRDRNELQDRPTGRRAAQPAPRAAGGRYLVLVPEALVVFVPHDPARTLGPGREQRQQRNGDVGVAPGAVREPARIGGERDRAAAPVAQSQDRGPIVQRHDDRVDFERHQRGADAGPRVVLVDTFLQPCERTPRRGIGLLDGRRQHAPRGGQPNVRLPRSDADAVLEPQASRSRAPRDARRDAGAIARRHDGPSRAHVADDLLQLGLLQGNERIEQDQNGGAMGALGGERRE